MSTSDPIRGNQGTALDFIQQGLEIIPQGDQVFDAGVRVLGPQAVRNIIQAHAMSVRGFPALGSDVAQNKYILDCARGSVEATLQGRLASSNWDFVSASATAAPRALHPNSVLTPDAPGEVLESYRQLLSPPWQQRYDWLLSQHDKPSTLWRPSDGLVYRSRQGMIWAMQAVMWERARWGMGPVDYSLPAADTLQHGAQMLVNAGYGPPPPVPQLAPSAPIAVPDEISPETVRAAHAMDTDLHAVFLAMTFSGNLDVLRDIKSLTAKLSAMSPEFQALDGATRVAIARDVVWQLHADVSVSRSTIDEPLSFADQPGKPSLLRRAFQAHGQDIARFHGFDQDVICDRNIGRADSLDAQHRKLVNALDGITSSWFAQISAKTGFDVARREAALRAMADDIILTYAQLSPGQRAKYEGVVSGEFFGEIPSSFVAFRVASLKGGDLTVNGTMTFATREINRAKAEIAVRERLRIEVKQNGEKYTETEISSLAERFGKVAASNPEWAAQYIEVKREYRSFAEDIDYPVQHDIPRLTAEGLRFVQGLPESTHGMVRPLEHGMPEQMVRVLTFHEQVFGERARAIASGGARKPRVGR